MNAILTSKQAKRARIELGISQANIAKELDIQRSYLSQFENGKFILPDKDLDALKSHYETAGYNFDATTPTSTQEPANTNTDDAECHTRIMDGFVVPDYLEPDQVENLLFEYEENIQKINQLCIYDIRENHTEEPFFGEPFVRDDAHKQFTREALILMARNFNIVEELRGHDSCLPVKDQHKASSTGDFIGVEFHQLTN